MGQRERIVTRVFAACIAHETHGFNRIPTCLDDFDIESSEGIARATDGDSGWAGLFQVASEQGWQVVHPLSAGAMPSGPASKETFEALWSRIEPSMRADGPFDAVLWLLHGGMMTQHLDDPEGEIVRRTRAILGDSIPIAVSLDIHANVSPAMVRQTNIICGYHTTPHIDLRETGLRAARLLQRTLAGEIDPVTYSVHPPVLGGIDHGRTTDPNGPIPRMLRRAEEVKQSHPGLLDVSFFSGFPFCDTAETGASAIVVSNGEDRRCAALAEEYGDEIWNSRKEISIDFVSMDEAVDRVFETRGASRPYLVGDFTDTPHGGGYGDATNLLLTFLRRGVRNAVFGPVWDPPVVEQALAVGSGQPIDVRLGGHADPEHGGGPIVTSALVKAVSGDGKFIHKGPFGQGTPGSLGPSACIEIDGIEVIVVKRPNAIYDREQLRLFGIEAESKDVLAFKAYNHMRADFEPICRGLAYADSGGIFCFDYARFDYRKVRRPIWPLDDIGQSQGETYRAHTALGQKR